MMEETMKMKKSLSALLLFLTLMAGAAVLTVGAAGLAAGDHQEKFEKILPLSAAGRFSLKNTNGKVIVSTWTRSEVEIKAVKIAKRRKEDLDRVKIEVTAAGDAVAVDTIYERSFLRDIRVDVNYEIKVPEGVRLENIRSTNGDVEITGRFGEASARTTNGDIKLDSTSGRCTVHTTNGDVQVVNAKGPIEAGTTNGNIHVDVKALEAGIMAQTTNGSITVRSSGDLNAVLKAHTTNGHIRTDFPITIKGYIETRRTVEGTLGNGGPEINLRTTNGSITLSR
jgi:DUF4097 and DUF4098 domain-containing protein YvlB